jgi:DNA-binding NtrC family response regulator
MPRTQSKPEDATKVSERLPAAAGALLLVEDNPDVAEATVPIIEDLGFTVRVVGSAALALEAIKTDYISVVVSDIVMAGIMDGAELGRAIRQQNPELPVILITGYNNRSDEARDEFIVLRKPFTVTDLGRAIARCETQIAQQQASNVVRMTAPRKPQRMQ